MGNIQTLTRAGKEINSTEKAKKLGRLGGIKSGEAKRANKTFRELTQLMLGMKVSENNIVKLVKTMFPEMKDEDITARAAMIARQYDKAIKKGDSKAFELLRDTAGEKPTDKVENTGDIIIKWQDNNEK